MLKLTLSEQDVAEIRPLLQDIQAQYTSTDDPTFLNQATLYAHALPKSVRQFLNHFRLSEVEGVCSIAGYPIDDPQLGPTPQYWKTANSAAVTQYEFLLVLYASLLGEVFGWSTQQGGHIVHDIAPIPGHEQEQMGSGSTIPLCWHTEEAFHPHRCDYLALFCLRNPYQVPTTIATLDGISFEEDQFAPLFENLFTIRPDESHFKKNRSHQQAKMTGVEQALDRAYLQIEAMNSNPQKVAVLFGDRNRPYLRIDPFFMDSLEDQEAQQALDRLCQLLEHRLVEVAFQPGECCFIDNYLAVHGRKAFTPRYDGADRWLKRVNITRDLRKSRELRPSTTARVLF